MHRHWQTRTRCHAHSPFGLSALINMLQAAQMKSLLLIFFRLFLLFLLLLRCCCCCCQRQQTWHTHTRIKLFSSYNKCNNFHVSTPPAPMQNVARSSGKYYVLRGTHDKFGKLRETNEFFVFRIFCIIHKIIEQKLKKLRKHVKVYENKNKKLTKLCAIRIATLYDMQYVL